ncbi:hypothetical protein D3C80_1621190 [compost metagenome]
MIERSHSTASTSLSPVTTSCGGSSGTLGRVSVLALIGGRVNMVRCCSLSRNAPERETRVFTVPSGTPVIWATSRSE